MKLILIRHAIAVPSGTPDVPDDDRPLTPNGRRRFIEAAKGLVEICKCPDVLLTSPLSRAAATAEIAAKAWRDVSPTPEHALAHGTLEDVLGVLSQYAGQRRVAAVGHEPMLSTLLARLLGSEAPDRLALRKGGAAQVDVPGALDKGARLDWIVRPRMLRALA